MKVKSDYLNNKYGMGIPVIALFSGAYMSNPDEESFKRFLEMEYRRGHSSWLEAKIASIVASNLIKRDDYYFFSIVRIPSEKLSYLGIFSKWFQVPPGFIDRHSL